MPENVALAQAVVGNSFELMYAGSLSAKVEVVQQFAGVEVKQFVPAEAMDAKFTDLVSLGSALARSRKHQLYRSSSPREPGGGTRNTQNQLSAADPAWNLPKCAESPDEAPERELTVENNAD